MASRAGQRTFLLGFVPHFHAKKKKSYHAEPQKVLGVFCPGSVRINHLARNQQFKYNTNNNAKQRQYGGNLGALSA
jgi:hypothetical protein